MRFLKIIFTFIFLSSIPPLMGNVTHFELRPFETDGCTMFVEGSYRHPSLWKHCCLEHDLRYWFGGSQADMDSADTRLKSCIIKAAGPLWATLIYAGVRMGHFSPLKNKYQWAWAWTPKRVIAPLSLEERHYVIKELRKLKVSEVDLESFIKLNFSLAK